MSKKVVRSIKNDEMMKRVAKTESTVTFKRETLTTNNKIKRLKLECSNKIKCLN